MTFKVPNAATDVNFRHAFFSGTIDEADFAITEAEFLKWAATNDWRPIEFRTDAEGFHRASESGFELPTYVTVTPVRRALNESIDDLDILNGYYFDDSIGDAGLYVVFDKDRRPGVCSSNDLLIDRLHSLCPHRWCWTLVCSRSGLRCNLD